METTTNQTEMEMMILAAEVKDSEFRGHAPCPQCHSRDNLAIYGDHSYCFGCGYYEGEHRGLRYVKQQLLLEDLAKKKTPIQNSQNSDRIVLPWDFTFDIPSEPLAWLRTYGLTNKEINDNNIGWSSEYNHLIYPIFDLDNNLLCYQGRNFQKNPKQRFFIRGNPESVIHACGRPSDTVVLVEDTPSAIKVGRVNQCMALWGSVINTQRIVRLSKVYKNLIIWLDLDKVAYASNAGMRAQGYFENVKWIISENDPKEYNDADIRKAIECGTPDGD